MHKLISVLMAAALLWSVPASAQINPLSPEATEQLVSQVDSDTIGAAIAAAQANGAQGQVNASPSQMPVTTLPTIPGPMAGAASPLDVPSQTVATNGPPLFDYRVNLQSLAFGARLFTGAFARAGAGQFNPDYVIGVGDKLVVRLWGAFNFNQVQTVDPQGNIFLPSIGPIAVLGVRNQDLQQVVKQAAARTFRSNVSSYASLAAAQPVRVFVSGFVRRPGLYDGTSMDSLLHYLDLAGGIDTDRGSFIQVQVKRGEQVRARVNLYEFLFRGVTPLINLSDGDVVFVGPRQNTVKVTGLAENANIFEFPAGVRTTSKDLILMARPLASATNMRIVRNTGAVRNVEYYALENAATVDLTNGDEVEFTADKKPGTITVRIEGEHESPEGYVLPYGARLGDLLKQIRFSERSDTQNIQLFRLNVKARQKEALTTSLRALEGAALNARSGTSEEARLRAQEADQVLKWIDRAKQVEPVGQVVLAAGEARDELSLENGDVLRVPRRDGLVLISGEVVFPNAFSFSRGLSIDDYVARTGGYTQSRGAKRIVIAHQSGAFDEVKTSDRSVVAGDSILVLPKADPKSRQWFKDMTEILYRIAISAGVVLRL